MSGLPSSLLFACSQNSVRSPMAEAMAKRLYGQSVFIDSVGVRASEVDGFAADDVDPVLFDDTHCIAHDVGNDDEVCR